MEALFNGVGRTLALQVSKGLMTLEQLDQPPPGYAYIEEARTASQTPCDWTDEKQKVPHYNRDGEAYWTYPRPTLEYPPAKPYRNLAREWITANPKEWERMNGREPVSVQVTDPKDFADVLPPRDTPTQTPNLPLAEPPDFSDGPF